VSTITDPNIFAGRLARDCMNGWIAFKTGPNQDDVAVRLGRYPVTHAGGGWMRVVVDMPEDFAPIECHHVSLLSRKANVLQEFSLREVITHEAKSFIWLP